MQLACAQWDTIVLHVHIARLINSIITVGFAVLSSVSPDTTESVWAVPESADSLYQLQQLVHTNCK